MVRLVFWICSVLKNPKYEFFVNYEATTVLINIQYVFFVVQPACLEHLCINLCAETMQHFYNTHIFKSSIESCRDEGIKCDVEVDYVDNVPCIDLVSSLVSVIEEILGKIKRLVPFLIFKINF